MKKALIITGGYINFNKLKIVSEDYDLIIAADSGYISAQKLNLDPHLIIGDFDSASVPNLNTEIITFPCEKDDTDTMLACKTAAKRGADKICIVGGTGGRADHFLSNVFLLERFKDIGINVTLTDGENKISVLKNESIAIKNDSKYFSLFSLEDSIITAEGCKYPLNNYSLSRENPSFAVSNEVVNDSASVTVIGKVILCEYK